MRDPKACNYLAQRISMDPQRATQPAFWAPGHIHPILYRFYTNKNMNQIHKLNQKEINTKMYNLLIV